MRKTIYTLSKTEFEVIDGKVHHKLISTAEVYHNSNSKNRDPEWWSRVEELKEKEGLDDYQIAKILDLEGFKSAHGKRITVDTIRCRRHNRKG